MSNTVLVDSFKPNHTNINHGNLLLTQHNRKQNTSSFQYANNYMLMLLDDSESSFIFFEKEFETYNWLSL
jgi:hypothetical protein